MTGVNDDRVQRYAEAVYADSVGQFPSAEWQRRILNNVMAVADAEQAELRADRDRLAAENVLLPDQIAELRANVARVSLAALAVAEAWDDHASSEPCADCLRSGVALMTFDDDERIDNAVEVLRAALAGEQP